MNASEAANHVEMLYREHHDTIRDYLHRRCRNAHLSDDLASETFERALRALTRDGAVPHENPIAWLRAIAKNLLTDHYRKASSRRETNIDGDLYGDTEVDHLHLHMSEAQRPADAALLAQEALAETRRLLDVLTPGQRDAMLLRAVDGYSTAEAAVIMGRSPQAIRSLRHKALRRLVEIQHAVQAEEPAG